MKEAEGYELFLANRSNSTTGYMGVTEDDGRSASRGLRQEGCIGVYCTAVEAAVAYGRSMRQSAGSIRRVLIVTSLAARLRVLEVEWSMVVRRDAARRQVSDAGAPRRERRCVRSRRRSAIASLQRMASLF